MADASFDVVSDFDQQELVNALDQARREIATRYDFKGSKVAFELGKETLTLTADDDYRAGAAKDLFESKAVRRGLSLSQSGVIAGLGSLLGAAAGLGAAVAVLTALNQQWATRWPAPVPYPITLPWLSLVIALLVVPGIAMAGAGLLTRSRLPIERRV